MKVTAATPGSTCTKEEFVDRSSSTRPCGLPAVNNINGEPRCSAHLPKKVFTTRKGQMPPQRLGQGLGITSDRAAIDN